MKVAVLYNTASEGGFLAEDVKYAKDAMSNARRIVKHFNNGGHEARLVRITRKKLSEELTEVKKWADVVFNLTEAVGLELVLEVIGKLEELNIPFAGASRKGHKLTSDKMLVKQVMKDNGVPTPDWKIYTRENLNEKWTGEFPVIVKATTEHGSMSIHQDAVVKNETELKNKVSELLNKYKDMPVLAEMYIEGREINSTVIGSFESAICLPLSEVVFEGKYKQPGVWPIYTYEAKYDHNTPDFDDAPARLVDWLSPEEDRLVKEMSVNICTLTECFDYARIDIRFDEKKRIPYIVDLNSYPCLLDDPISDTICVSRLALGWNYLRLIEEIAKSGILRNSRLSKNLTKK